jgi:hypothetical protein
LLTPDQIEQLASDIVSGHQEKMVAAMLKRLIKALASDGELTVKELRLLEALAEANRTAVDAILLKYRKSIDRQTRELVTAALAASDVADTEILSRLYPGVSMAGSSAMFERIAQETAEGLAQIIARDNLKMSHGAQRIWYDVAGEAITRWNHGVMSQDRIIADAVRRLQANAVSFIDYKSGVRSNIDVAVRRHVVTQVGQAAGRMTMARLQQFGHDLVQTSAHFGARPDHAVWQGRAFSLTGAGGYPDFHASTGYGTGPGLQGWNCKHTFGPYFPGETTLPQLPKQVRGMTNDQYYEATQTQRRHERAIRETKREAHALRLAGADDTTARLKLGKQQRRLKQFVDERGLRRLPKREKAYGIGVDQPRALRAIGLSRVKITADVSASRHALERSIERGIPRKDLIDAIEHPLHRTEVTRDSAGRPSYKLIGRRATIAVNPETGLIVSTWKTKSRLRRKHGGGT